MIILDTNVISEIMRQKPDEQVALWYQAQDPKHIYTTAIAEAELFKGIEIMAEGKKKQVLLEAIKGFLKQDMEGRILPFDSAAARWFGTIFAARKSKGRPITPLDTQIAAIARAHDAKLATRNVRDFEGCGIKIINPWHV